MGIRWVDGAYLLSRFRFDKLIVDEETDRLFVGLAIGGREFDAEVRHFSNRCNELRLMISKLYNVDVVS